MGDLSGDDALCREIWKACSGSLLDVPKAGEKVYYFPRLHVEQVITIYLLKFRLS